MPTQTEELVAEMSGELDRLWLAILNTDVDAVESHTSCCLDLSPQLAKLLRTCESSRMELEPIRLSCYRAESLLRRSRLTVQALAGVYQAIQGTGMYIPGVLS